MKFFKIIALALSGIFFSCTVYADRCVTAYFVVPESFVGRMEMIISVPDVDDTVISSGNLNPNKHYEILSINQEWTGDWVVGDRFTDISKDITGKGTVKEISSIYPLKHTKFEGVVVGTTDSGKKVVHIILKRHWIKEVKRFLRSETYNDEAARVKIKIQNAYIGKTKESVLARFPELAGSTGTGEDEIPRFSDNIWSCNSEDNKE